MNALYQQRVLAIKRYLEGEKPSVIYSMLRHTSTWFFKWKHRYELWGLEGLKDLSKAPKHQAEQIPETVEAVIVNLRKSREKRERDDTQYALIGALAIQHELKALGYETPCVKTIPNVLRRHGLITPAPPPQSVQEIIDRHYPAFEITRPGQMHQLDLVGPRYLSGDSQMYYFYNVRDVCRRRIAIEVGKDHQAQTIVNAVIQIWQRMGRPRLLQHDNALEFRGSNRYPRSAGLLTKLCLALEIESIFIPAREPYRNGSIENFNGLFQRLVLETQHLDNFPHLQRETKTFERVANSQHPHVPLHGKTSEEYERSLNFHPVVLDPTFTFGKRFRWRQPPEGKVSFICRIRKSGKITIASEKFMIDPALAWEYVYATICVKERVLKIYHTGNVIKTFPYELKL